MGDAEEIFGADVSLVHHRSGGAHAAACAPGILDLLADVRARDGLVLELGCGSGPLTAELVAAGHRVIATDASSAMVELATERIGSGAEAIGQLILPRDPLPEADAIVAVGHPLNYVQSIQEFDAALISIAASLRPQGRLALDVCDLEWGCRNLSSVGRAGDDWAIIIEFTTPAAERFDRDVTTFLPNQDGSWRREREHHTSVLVDTARLPALLEQHGVEASVRGSFGEERLPHGLRALIGQRRGSP